MKKAFGTFLTLFAVFAALFIGGASASQATTPPSNCANQAGLVNVVICEIDANDNSVLTDLVDFKVLIPGNVLSGNDLSNLVSVLDNANVVITDVVNIKSLIVNLSYINVDPDVIVILPCGCSH